MNDLPQLSRPVQEWAKGSMAARRAMEGGRFERLLLADWKSLVFLHFEVDPGLLQAEIPFELDLFEGRCFATLVAFRMEGMRLRAGGRVTRWLTAPIASHHFLNLRVYVKHRDETGIFFVREWLDSRAAVALGPMAFGLPYRYATVNYNHGGNAKSGRVAGECGTLEYTAHEDIEEAEECGDALDAFLLERYTAFCTELRPRFFRVWHRPWKVKALKNVEICSETLLANACPAWWPSARYVCGHFSEGAEDVWMGRPHAVSGVN